MSTQNLLLPGGGEGNLPMMRSGDLAGDRHHVVVATQRMQEVCRLRMQEVCGVGKISVGC